MMIVIVECFEPKPKTKTKTQKPKPKPVVGGRGGKSFKAEDSNDSSRRMRLQHLTILIFINLYFSSALQPIKLLNRCKSLLKNPFLSKSDATSLHKQLQERQISPFLPFSRSLYSTICSPTVLSEELRGRRNIPQLIRLFLLFLPSFLLTRPRLARASISVSQAAKESTGVSPVQGLILWFVLFATSASLHAAESAITKLSQWKVLIFIPLCPQIFVALHLKNVVFTLCRFRSWRRRRGRSLPLPPYLRS